MGGPPVMPRSLEGINYRKLAFEHHLARLFCGLCVFGMPEVLETAHLGGCCVNKATCMQLYGVLFNR